MLYHWDAEKGTNGLKMVFGGDGQPVCSMYNPEGERPVVTVEYLIGAEKQFRAEPSSFDSLFEAIRE